MPLQRICEICQAVISEGGLAFKFSLNVNYVGTDQRVDSLAMITGEYCGRCVKEGKAHDNLVECFAVWQASREKKGNGQIKEAATVDNS